MPTKAEVQGWNGSASRSPELRDLWRETLMPQITAALKALNVRWVMIMAVCMVYTDEDIGSRVTITVGVNPGSVSREDGAVAVGKCLELLKEHEITDVEVVMEEAAIERF